MCQCLWATPGAVSRYDQLSFWKLLLHVTDSIWPVPEVCIGGIPQTFSCGMLYQTAAKKQLLLGQVHYQIIRSMACSGVIYLQLLLAQYDSGVRRQNGQKIAKCQLRSQFCCFCRTKYLHTCLLQHLDASHTIVVGMGNQALLYRLL